MTTDDRAKEAVVRAKGTTHASRPSLTDRAASLTGITPSSADVTTNISARQGSATGGGRLAGIAAITVTAITLVSYTAMSGLIGGGGLGDLAVRYGYQRYQPDVMAVTVILLLILVQVLQMVGDRLVIHFSRK